jgi:hypothetical protein
MLKSGTQSEFHVASSRNAIAASTATIGPSVPGLMQQVSEMYRPAKPCGRLPNSDCVPHFNQ